MLQDFNPFEQTDQLAKSEESWFVQHLNRHRIVSFFIWGFCSPGWHCWFAIFHSRSFSFGMLLCLESQVAQSWFIGNSLLKHRIIFWSAPSDLPSSASANLQATLKTTSLPSFKYSHLLCSTLKWSLSSRQVTFSWDFLDAVGCAWFLAW